MAERTPHPQQQEKERRLALLALSGEQPEPHGPCPDAELLAALVEGKVTPVERTTCLTHLAACESCYALWLQLDQAAQEETRASTPRRILRLLNRPRVLAATGSLLAAAASITVFLTITTDPVRHDLLRFPEKAALESTRPAPFDPPADQTALDRNAARPSSPAALSPEANAPNRDQAGQPPSAPGRPALAESQKELAPQRSPMMRSAREKTAVTGSALPPAGKNEEVEAKGKATLERERADQKTAAPPPALVTTAPAATSLTLEAWRDRLRAGCQGQPEPAFLETIRAEGQQLLRGSKALAPQERRQLEQLLDLLGQPASVDERCQRLLRQLEPEPGTHQ